MTTPILTPDTRAEPLGPRYCTCAACSRTVMVPASPGLVDARGLPLVPSKLE